MQNAPFHLLPTAPPFWSSPTARVSLHGPRHPLSFFFPRIIQRFQIKQTKGSGVSLSQDIRAALLLGLTHLLGDEMGSVPVL